LSTLIFILEIYVLEPNIVGFYLLTLAVPTTSTIIPTMNESDLMGHGTTPSSPLGKLLASDLALGTTFIKLF
jgi:hypothetical protein